VNILASMMIEGGLPGLMARLLVASVALMAILGCAAFLAVVGVFAWGALFG